MLTINIDKTYKLCYNAPIVAAAFGCCAGLCMWALFCGYLAASDLAVVWGRTDA